jgi:hypothetical protein
MADAEAKLTAALTSANTDFTADNLTAVDGALAAGATAIETATTERQTTIANAEDAAAEVQGYRQETAVANDIAQIALLTTGAQKETSTREEVQAAIDQLGSDLTVAENARKTINNKITVYLGSTDDTTKGLADVKVALAKLTATQTAADTDKALTQDIDDDFADLQKVVGLVQTAQNDARTALANPDLVPLTSELATDVTAVNAAITNGAIAEIDAALEKLAADRATAQAQRDTAVTAAGDAEAAITDEQGKFTDVTDAKQALADALIDGANGDGSTEDINTATQTLTTAISNTQDAIDVANTVDAGIVGNEEDVELAEKTLTARLTNGGTVADLQKATTSFQTAVDNATTLRNTAIANANPTSKVSDIVVNNETVATQKTELLQTIEDAKTGKATTGDVEQAVADYIAAGKVTIGLHQQADNLIAHNAPVSNEESVQTAIQALKNDLDTASDSTLQEQIAALDDAIRIESGKFGAAEGAAAALAYGEAAQTLKKNQDVAEAVTKLTTTIGLAARNQSSIAALIADTAALQTALTDTQNAIDLAKTAIDKVGLVGNEAPVQKQLTQLTALINNGSVADLTEQTQALTDLTKAAVETRQSTIETAQNYVVPEADAKNADVIGAADHLTDVIDQVEAGELPTSEVVNALTALQTQIIKTNSAKSRADWVVAIVAPYSAEQTVQSAVHVINLAKDTGDVEAIDDAGFALITALNNARVARDTAIATANAVTIPAGLNNVADVLTAQTMMKTAIEQAAANTGTTDAIEQATTELANTITSVQAIVDEANAALNAVGVVNNEPDVSTAVQNLNDKLTSDKPVEAKTIDEARTELIQVTTAAQAARKSAVDGAKAVTIPAELQNNTNVIAAQTNLGKAIDTNATTSTVIAATTALSQALKATGDAQKAADAVILTPVGNEPAVIAAVRQVINVYKTGSAAAIAQATTALQTAVDQAQTDRDAAVQAADEARGNANGHDNADVQAMVGILNRALQRGNNAKTTEINNATNLLNGIVNAVTDAETNAQKVLAGDDLVVNEDTVANAATALNDLLNAGQAFEVVTATTTLQRVIDEATTDRQTAITVAQTTIAGSANLKNTDIVKARTALTRAVTNGQTGVETTAAITAANTALNNLIAGDLQATIKAHAALNGTEPVTGETAVTAAKTALTAALTTGDAATLTDLTTALNTAITVANTTRNVAVETANDVLVSVPASVINNADVVGATTNLQNVLNQAANDNQTTAGIEQARLTLAAAVANTNNANVIAGAAIDGIGVVGTESDVANAVNTLQSVRSTGTVKAIIDQTNVLTHAVIAAKTARDQAITEATTVKTDAATLINPDVKQALTSLNQAMSAGNDGVGTTGAISIASGNLNEIMNQVQTALEGANAALGNVAPVALEDKVKQDVLQLTTALTDGDAATIVGLTTKLTQDVNGANADRQQAITDANAIDIPEADANNADVIEARTALENAIALDNEGTTATIINAGDALQHVLDTLTTIKTQAGDAIAIAKPVMDDATVKTTLAKLTADLNSGDASTIEASTADLNTAVGNAKGVADGVSGYAANDVADQPTAYQGGYTAGYTSGHDSYTTDEQTGKTAGSEDGLAGKTAANVADRSAGYQAGYAAGYTNGHDSYTTDEHAGEKAGLDDGLAGKYATDVADKSAGYQAGYTAGYTNGHTSYTTDEQTGKTAGSEDGLAGKDAADVADKSAGYQAGYIAGYADGNASYTTDEQAGKKAGSEDGLAGKAAADVADKSAGYQAGYIAGYADGNGSYTKDEQVGEKAGSADGLAGKDAADVADKSAGYQAGYIAGYTNGHASYATDEQVGEKAGSADGLAGKTATDVTGESAGYQVGYAQGYATGRADFTKTSTYTDADGNVMTIVTNADDVVLNMTATAVINGVKQTAILNADGSHVVAAQRSGSLSSTDGGFQFATDNGELGISWTTATKAYAANTEASALKYSRVAITRDLEGTTAVVTDLDGSVQTINKNWTDGVTTAVAIATPDTHIAELAANIQAWISNWQIQLAKAEAVTIAEGTKAQVLKQTGITLDFVDSTYVLHNADVAPDTTAHTAVTAFQGEVTDSKDVVYKTSDGIEAKVTTNGSGSLTAFAAQDNAGNVVQTTTDGATFAVTTTDAAGNTTSENLDANSKSTLGTITVTTDAQGGLVVLNQSPADTTVIGTDNQGNVDYAKVTTTTNVHGDQTTVVADASGRTTAIDQTWQDGTTTVVRTSSTSAISNALTSAGILQKSGTQLATGTTKLANGVTATNTGDTVSLTKSSGNHTTTAHVDTAKTVVNYTNVDQTTTSGHTTTTTSDGAGHTTQVNLTTGDGTTVTWVVQDDGSLTVTHKNADGKTTTSIVSADADGQFNLGNSIVLNVNNTDTKPSLTLHEVEEEPIAKPQAEQSEPVNGDITGSSTQSVVEQTSTEKLVDKVATGNKATAPLPQMGNKDASSVGIFGLITLGLTGILAHGFRRRKD